MDVLLYYITAVFTLAIPRPRATPATPHITRLKKDTIEKYERYIHSQDTRCPQ